MEQTATRRTDGENVRVHNLQELAETLLALPLEVVQLAADQAENVQRRATQELRGKTELRANTRESKKKRGLTCSL